MRLVSRLFVTLTVGLIRFYQRWISPLFPPTCRFHPTCSEYARQAVERYGPLRGTWMALKRLGRCHPFHPGGYDPVPTGDETSSRPATSEGL
ncbi:MAG: membrane protein insertion efficiency factor YidD [Deltaproteobacteria bacterium]|nr:MAG: membrane protein insertion efficiency factor YidD [Deltaproteobacteria bacterium]